ncbi:MAG: chemotaxis protein CheW [Candidatus Hydrogenedentes bacterium]|nr:chemotaxis protein CheW [Candidatus Hydrogenedentota bacterium]
MGHVLENTAADGCMGSPLRSKYLTFSLGEEVYGLQIQTVQEIVSNTPVTRVPRTPEFLRGIVNLRGRIIPVMDLGVQFGAQPKPDTAKTCIIVVQIVRDSGKATLRLLVDEVNEVLDIHSSQVEPPPEIVAHGSHQFIFGMAKVGECVVMLLDTDRVLTHRELFATESLHEVRLN